jgi:chromosomal replication initiator protein
VDNSSSNIRELKSAITNVIFAMKMNKDHTLSEGQVKELLGNHFIGGGKKRITIEMIQAAVEDFYGVSHKDIVGRGRARSIVRPRQVAIYLCRDLSETTLSNIGKAFNRDHTTVLHSCELISSQMQEDRNLREELEAVREKIRIQQY